MERSERTLSSGSRAENALLSLGSKTLVKFEAASAKLVEYHLQLGFCFHYQRESASFGSIQVGGAPSPPGSKRSLPLATLVGSIGITQSKAAPPLAGHNQSTLFVEEIS